MANKDFWADEYNNEKFGIYGFTRGDFKKNSWMFGVRNIRQATTSELMSIDMLMKMRNGNVKKFDGKELHYPVDHSGFLKYSYLNLLFKGSDGFDFYYKGEEYKTVDKDGDKCELIRVKDGKVLASTDTDDDIFEKPFDGDKSVFDVIDECGFVIDEKTLAFEASFTKD